jgi:hypothetical protein
MTLRSSAANWMVYLGAEDHDLRQTKTVIFALLERWRAFGQDLSDLGEFLSDRLTSDFSLIFEFVRPKRLFEQIFHFMAKNGELEDVIKLVQYCASELPKEPYIVDALIQSLAILISHTVNTEDNWKPATRNRDFEQEQVEIARGLRSKLVMSQSSRGE